MATLEQLQSALVKADAAGDAEAARAFAGEIRRLRQAPSTPTTSGPQAAPDPTGSFGQNVAAGAGKFVADTGMGVRSLLNDAAVSLENAAPTPVRNAVNTVGGLLGLKPAGQVQAEGVKEIEETRRRDAPLMSTVGGNVGYFGGALSTAPLLPATSTIRGGAALGTALGATQPAVSWSERGQNALIGGATGGASQVATNALARIVSPNTSAEVRALLDQGVTPTPGQILGGSVKRTEEALTSVPIIGDAIKSGQRRAVTDLNRTAINRSLEPIGESLPAGLTGREAIEFVNDRLSSRYNTLLPQLNARADQQFTQQIGTVQSMVNTGALDPNVARAFNRILQNDVLGKFQGQNRAITGQTLKQIESDLGQQISRMSSSTDADQRLIGDALQQVQAELRGLVQRSNPARADELRALNTGWANFKRVQKAAAGVGAEDGVFSAAQLQSAVKAADRSKDKGAFARGNALMQDLSDPAKAVLGNTVPDSGTAYRGMTAMGAGGLAGLLNPYAGAAVLTAPVMYSRPGQNALATVLARRPDGANRLADLIRQSAAPAVLGNSAIAVQQ